MFSAYLKALANEFRNLGIAFEKGLTDSELSNREREFGFEFPPDLKLLLQSFLPVEEEFPNWRSGPDKKLRDWFDWPFRGMCFDIENNTFWLPEWGARPENLGEAFEIARQAVAEAPRLIPVFSHRYIPDRPAGSGNPVLSVYQTDIIYYGFDLPSYFNREFGISEPLWAAKDPLRVPFWSDIIDR
jgi:hypothetical protein